MKAIGLDLAILLFTLAGLRFQARSGGDASLYHTLVTQGVAYATLTCFLGIPMAVRCLIAGRESRHLRLVLIGVDAHESELYDSPTVIGQR